MKIVALGHTDKRKADVAILAKELTHLGLLTPNMSDAEIEVVFQNTYDVVNPLLETAPSLFTNEFKKRAYDGVFPSSGTIPRSRRLSYWNKFTAAVGELIVEELLRNHPEATQYKPLLLFKVAGIVEAMTTTLKRRLMAS